MTRHGVVMAGGSGERFWPLSTPTHPKQLLDLTGEGCSMLEASLRRLEPVIGENLWISTSPLLAGPIRDAGLVPAIRVLAEPTRRNTLGAVVWTMANLAVATEADFSVAITTSDHAIRPYDAFANDIRTALDIAESEGSLVIIGIPPTRPATGYGYIERQPDGSVTRFTEKPDAEHAARFVARGNYLWNSGMFFWTESAFDRELALGNPAASHTYREIKRVLSGGQDASSLFETLASQAIDVALMERAQRVHCVPATFKWDDVGTWDSLLRTVELDANGNAVVGTTRLLDTSGSVIYNGSRRRVSTLGIEGLIIVVTDDEVLITRPEHAQEVRRLASRQDD